MMELPNIIAECKAAQADFQRSDKSFATASFCQVACKILDNVVKRAKNEEFEFEELVLGIWIVIDSVNKLLPQLHDGSSLTELVEKLFRQCARVVLDIKWQNLDEDAQSQQNFKKSLSECHQQMTPRGFTRFGVLHEVMDNAWTDPVLTMVMGNDEDNGNKEGLAYILAQDPEILKLRVELMYQENCDEFALNLCTWCLRHPALASDFNLHKVQFVLLHRLSYIDKLQEECQKMGSVDCIRLINSLQGKEEHKELSTMLAHTFLVQNWIKPADNHSEIELLRLWIKLQYQADQNQEQFISSLWAIAKVSRSTEQLLLVVDAVREQFGDTFLQFCLDLCIFAINVDKGCWEKLKESNSAGPNKEIMERKKDMAQVCNKLAHIMSHVSPKIAFCCTLTAFSMLPSEQSLQAVRDAHIQKTVSPKPQCCSNCATAKGDCLKGDGNDKGSHNVNVASLYEVERLCNILRPDYLGSDIDISSLLSLCKQYLMKEKGEAIQSVLVQRKPVTSVRNVPSMDTGLNCGEKSETSVPKQLQPTIETVDTASYVNNIPQNVSMVHKQGEIDLENKERLMSIQSAKRAAANQNLIQQLVLKHLPSDTVERLLHLIQSGQLSPIELNQIMIENPSKAIQILDNIACQANAGSFKPSPPQQVQPVHIQQPYAKEPCKQQQQSGSGDVWHGMPQIASSANLDKSGLITMQHQSDIHQQAKMHCQQPIVEIRAVPTTVGSHVFQQQQPIRLRPQHQIRTSLIQTPQVLQGLEFGKIQSVVPAVHLGNTTKITQPLHIMTFKQSGPAQTSASTGQKQMLIHTSSQMYNHLSGSGGSVKGKAHITHLTPASVSGSNCMGKIGPRALCSGIVSQGTNSASSLIHMSADEKIAGNRHYSINNLLFTGEQQNSALSITIPDKLPEISVDSVSDTLRALSDPVSSDEQTMSKDVLKHAEMPGLQTGLKLAEMPVLQTGTVASITQLPINMLQVSPNSLSPARNRHQTPLAKQQVSINPVQVQIRPTNAILYAHGSSSSLGHGTLSYQSSQVAQPLPSFSSLFVSNTSQQPGPAPQASSVSPSSVFTSISPSVKQPIEPIRGDQKVITGNKTIKKEKEFGYAEKEKMVQILRQAMTLNIGIKNKKGPEKNGQLVSDQQLVSSSLVGPTLATGSKSTVTGGTAYTVSQANLVFHHSSQPVETSLGAFITQQNPSTMLHSLVYPTTTVPINTCVTMNTGAGVSGHTVLSTASFVPGSSSSTRTVFPLPAFSSSNQSILKQHNIIYEKANVGKMTGTSVFGKSYSMPSTGAIGHGRSTTFSESLLLNSAAPMNKVKTDVVTAHSVSNPNPAQTYLKTPIFKQELHEQDFKTSVCSSILPEGSMLDSSADNDQSIATYRCIICAKAFITLDALRLHVKQICRPGLSQPTNRNDRMALNKAQATEAGLETSTVFQCMRCFELCISEAGIREHKLVCSKGPKLKVQAKPKIKSELSTTVEEQETQAKVMELLNKCLGENREKLAQEAQLQANKQINAKKKQTRKRSTDDEPRDLAPISKKLKHDESLSSAIWNTVSRFSGAVSATGVKNATTAALKSGELEISCPVSSHTTMTKPPVTTASISPSFAVKPGNVLNPVSSHASVSKPAATAPLLTDSSTMVSNLTSHALVLNSGNKTVSQTPVPVVTYLDVQGRTRTTAVNSPLCNLPPAKGALGTSDSVGVVGNSEQKDKSIKANQVSQPAANAARRDKSESSECNMEESNTPLPPPPPPQYMEISSSGGYSFFKCQNCGQTLCSMSSFQEHWFECITKKPLPPRSKREEKEKISGSCNISSSKYGENQSQSTKSDEVSYTPASDSTSTFERASSKKPNGEDVCVSLNSSTVPLTLAGKKTKEIPAETSVADTQPIIRESIVLLKKVDMPLYSKMPSTKDCDIGGGKGSQMSRHDIGTLSQNVNAITMLAASSHAVSPSLNSPTEASGLFRKNDKNPQCQNESSAVFVSEGNSSVSRIDNCTVAVNDIDQGQSTDSKYCNICGRFFSKHSLFIQHLASVHVHIFKVEKVDNTTSYRCLLCQNVFPEFSQFVAHVSIHSQVIVQEYSKINSANQLCKSMNESAGQNLEKSSCQLTKAKEGRYDNTSDCGGNDPSKKSLVKSSTSITHQDGSEPSSQIDRRSHGRAAHKQALNKIYISSLGITSSAEPFGGDNKRKSFSDGRNSSERPKRYKVSRSLEEGRGMVEDSDSEDSSSTDLCDDHTSVYSVQESANVDSGHEKRHEKSSGKVPLASSGPLVSCPKISSPISSNTKKPSFLDSFLSFVNSRSPEAPLPLNQSRRRFSYFHDNLDSKSSSSTNSTKPKHSSCEVQPNRFYCTDTSQPSVPVSLLAAKSPNSFGDSGVSQTVEQKSLHPAGDSGVHQTAESKSPHVSSDSGILTSEPKYLHSNVESDICQTAEPKYARQAGDSGVPQNTESRTPISHLSKKNSGGFENVYYYGQFDKKLGQQCQVNLGHPVKCEDAVFSPANNHDCVGRKVINVKHCIVNLGQKVTSSMLSTASVKRNVTDTGNKKASDKDSAVKYVETPEASELVGDEYSLESDSDTVVVSVGDMDDTISVQDTLSLDSVCVNPSAEYDPSGGSTSVGNLIENCADAARNPVGALVNISSENIQENKGESTTEDIQHKGLEVKPDFPIQNLEAQVDSEVASLASEVNDFHTVCALKPDLSVSLSSGLPPVHSSSSQEVTETHDQMSERGLSSNGDSAAHISKTLSFQDIFVKQFSSATNMPLPELSSVSGPGSDESNALPIVRVGFHSEFCHQKNPEDSPNLEGDMGTKNESSVNQPVLDQLEASKCVLNEENQTENTGTSTQTCGTKGSDYNTEMESAAPCSEYSTDSTHLQKHLDDNVLDTETSFENGKAIGINKLELEMASVVHEIQASEELEACCDLQKKVTLETEMANTIGTCSEQSFQNVGMDGVFAEEGSVGVVCPLSVTSENEHAQQFELNVYKKSPGNVGHFKTEGVRATENASGMESDAAKNLDCVQHLPATFGTCSTAFGKSNSLQRNCEFSSELVKITSCTSTVSCNDQMPESKTGSGMRTGETTLDPKALVLSLEGGKSVTSPVLDFQYELACSSVAAEQTDISENSVNDSINAAPYSNQSGMNEEDNISESDECHHTVLNDVGENNTSDEEEARCEATAKVDSVNVQMRPNDHNNCNISDTDAKVTVQYVSSPLPVVSTITSEEKISSVYRSESKEQDDGGNGDLASEKSEINESKGLGYNVDILHSFSVASEGEPGFSPSYVTCSLQNTVKEGQSRGCRDSSGCSPTSFEITKQSSSILHETKNQESGSHVESMSCALSITDQPVRELLDPARHNQLSELASVSVKCHSQDCENTPSAETLAGQVLPSSSQDMMDDTASTQIEKKDDSLLSEAIEAHFHEASENMSCVNEGKEMDSFAFTTGTLKSVTDTRTMSGGRSEDNDPDGDLPELCIVPDPQGVVIRSCPVTPPENVKTESEAVEDTVSILSTGMNDYEVKLRPVQNNKGKARVEGTFWTSIEVKEEKVLVESDEPGPLESPTDTKKPLLGVKSLRKMHKPEPFVWEVDGEEDFRKRDRNERSLKAFRSKVHIAPFSWDCDGNDEEKNKTARKRDLYSGHRLNMGSLSFSWDTDESDCKEDSTDKKDSGKYSGLNNSCSDEKQQVGKDGVRKEKQSLVEKCSMSSSSEQTKKKSMTLSRPRESFRSLSCDKTFLTSSTTFSKSKHSPSQKRKPLRKSRSFDIETVSHSPVRRKWRQRNISLTKNSDGSSRAQISEHTVCEARAKQHLTSSDRSHVISANVHTRSYHRSGCGKSESEVSQTQILNCEGKSDSGAVHIQDASPADSVRSLRSDHVNASSNSLTRCNKDSSPGRARDQLSKSHSKVNDYSQEISSSQGVSLVSVCKEMETSNIRKDLISRERSYERESFAEHSDPHSPNAAKKSKRHRSLSPYASASHTNKVTSVHRPNSKVTSKETANTKQKHLAAMVRRRNQPTSWRSVSQFGKNPQSVSVNKDSTHQYEIIRVEPAEPDLPVNQCNTQTGETDTGSIPRTVHTRVSVKNMKPAPPRPENVKVSNDQKWLIDRKKSVDPGFPFTFKRAKMRTETQ